MSFLAQWIKLLGIKQHKHLANKTLLWEQNFSRKYFQFPIIFSKFGIYGAT